MRYVNVTASEKGSALVMAIVVLCILTVLGISALTTTNVDLQIASNERAYVNEFYVADSGWKESADWIDKSELPPQRVNGPGDDTVKNFGGGFQNLSQGPGGAHPPRPIPTGHSVTDPMLSGADRTRRRPECLAADPGATGGRACHGCW